MRIPALLSILFIVLNLPLYSALAKDQTIAEVFSLIKAKKWKEAENSATNTRNRALRKIVLSQKFLDPSSKNSFEEITAFLKENPEWPQKNAIKARAENNLCGKTNKKAILGWFKHNKAITGNGFKYYAYAAADLITDPKALSLVIKNGWIYGSFSPEEQKAYYSKFKGYLTEQDHIMKIDHNLLNEQNKLAKNSLNLVRAGYKNSFNVQVAIAKKEGNAIAAFKKVPAEYYTAGLIYQYLKSRKSNPPSASEIAGLIGKIKASEEYAGKLWKLQSYFAREYIEGKKYAESYKIAGSHLAVSPEDYSEAENLSGWLALRFLNKPNLAIKHFENFNKVVKSPISKARGNYWLARSYAASGDKEKAKSLFKEVASKYAYTYYGQLATSETGQDTLSLPENLAALNKNEQLVKNNDVLYAAKLVSRYGSNGLAQIYISAAVSQATPEEIYAFSSSVAEHNNVHHNVWLSKSATQKSVFMKNQAYPTPYKVANLAIEEPLIYSIIRQESVFDPKAVSSANALGLMQLIAPTACITAKKVGVKCAVAKLTTDPSYNIHLGSHYLNDMVQRFKGSYILAAAAYNAGPHKVDKWLGKFGDPRQMRDMHRIIDWIELIPYYETRNYVQRIIEGLQIYSAIMNKDDRLRIHEDLTAFKRSSI
jgi:soluble lytic murein transglycosylase